MSDTQNQVQGDDPLGGVMADLRINRYQLEKECSRQSSIYLYYADLLADAKAEEDGDKDALDKTFGQVELKLRDDPPEGVKITESTVKALVESSDAVDKAKKKLRESKKRRYRIEGIVNALGHKKAELDNLVVLWSKGYYMSDTGRSKSGNDEAQAHLRDSMNKPKEGEENKG